MATTPDQGKMTPSQLMKLGLEQEAQRRAAANAPPPPPAPPADQSVRGQFMRTALSDLPDAYRQQLPQSQDEAELTKAAAAIRREWQTDKAAYVKAHPEEFTPPPDYSKMNASQLMKLGLEQKAQQRS